MSVGILDGASFFAINFVKIKIMVIFASLKVCLIIVKLVIKR